MTSSHVEDDLFSYNLTHLRLPLVNPSKTYSSGICDLTEESASVGPLDSLLKDRWEGALKDGLFRYTPPNPLPFKLLPGPYSFLLQLNPDRGTARRKPETISSLGQPFDPEKFHFNKISPSEVLFSLRPRHWGALKVKEDDLPVGDVLINVSPLEWGHVLLVPNRGLNRPQRLSGQGLRLALELALLSSHPGFRLGFNSLCGYASVNHEHYHAYYLGYSLYLQNAALKSLVDGNGDSASLIPCYELVNYPAQGLVWVLEDVTHLEGLVGGIMRVGNHLQASNVAHNLFITRGAAASGRREENNDLNCLRVFLWARESSYGAKESDGFNPALCELGGHFPCKNEEAYGRLDEARLVALLSQLTEKPWASLRQAVLHGPLLTSPDPEDKFI